MPENSAFILAAIVFLALLLVVGTIALLLRRVARNNRNIEENDSLWENRDYRCPQCATPMEQGYVLMGKGMIWAPRRGGTIGSFAHIGQALGNTISLRLPPALNMAWRCAHCELTIVDHSKLIKKK